MRRKWWLHQACHVLDPDLRHQVQIQFRPDPGQRAGQDLGAVLGRVPHQVVGHDQVRELVERGGVVAGPVGEPAADHAGLQPEVQPGGHKRVLQAVEHDDLIDERVVWAAPLPHLLEQRALLLLGHVLDDQHLEVRPVLPDLLPRVDHEVEGVVVGGQVPDWAAAERIGG